MRQARWIAVALVVMSAVAGCGGRGEDANVDPEPLYSRPTEGFCAKLPFDLIEEQLGERMSDFDAWRFAFGSSETIGLADTMYAWCEMNTRKSKEDNRSGMGLVRVSTQTYSSLDEAKKAFDSIPIDPIASAAASARQVPNNVDEVRWEHTESEGSGLNSSDVVILRDRNAVVRVDVRYPKSVSREELQSSIVKFIEGTLSHVRQVDTRPAEKVDPASDGPAYRELTKGFCAQLPFRLFEQQLGRPEVVGPHENLDPAVSPTGFCQAKTVGRTEGAEDLSGGTISLYIRPFATAQKAADFLAAHFARLEPPAGLAGPIASVQSMSWRYVEPSGGNDGYYTIGFVDRNILVYLTVKSYSDNKVMVINPALTPAITDFLNETLVYLRA